MIASDNAAMIPGIIPVIDYSIEDYWYTMPIAQSIMDFVNGKSLNEIIDGVLQMCETLCKLHDKRIHHRISRIMMISQSRIEDWGLYLRLHRR